MIASDLLSCSFCLTNDSHTCDRDNLQAKLSSCPMRTCVCVWKKWMRPIAVWKISRDEPTYIYMWYLRFGLIISDIVDSSCFIVIIYIFIKCCSLPNPVLDTWFLLVPLLLIRLHSTCPFTTITVVFLFLTILSFSLSALHASSKKGRRREVWREGWVVCVFVCVCVFLLLFGRGVSGKL